ncbi:hypothetical protein A2631_01935 [Candidatus Daviesbacteria bacterium RIFCSPHIGHO2_01_FULL_44_29]|uniref:N-acetyltransferase domain-containing protein n=1 Tax=Candidatus Daviesbacteria bacterium RIFCSPHIGHO2_02_FULL_43_12 TaxID=1797776 RepID=A0A1F5KJP3_9BACT|nr:MAG: hypothetical protein A2631_01935 [Candidatus Daviesbacteria bacterium RIFCSPHIGHO2_01_FULL_44_29]OGE39566.1 MAG: hypothetical protein A3E86_01970 [Candidatus Daviesbacteria bacterium RIFCSPHIGHO2_12_FULL_47_45]OGE41157.1 MAG: hypothetical protein A3D25_01330 [Candidatus Daviesbacteria bacterium RIFCSPHIGHO2_02_FULL_43_12]OGE69356.1 MAG: hypothetical protein A3B55_03070 [Candidatus Daviesbacteria bacterium RIFCSPLOWO2_01_FULL_43_15]
MSDFKLIPSTGEPNPEDKEALRQGMLSYHQSKGKVWGGVIVAFEWNGVEIQSIWVDQSLRGQDWGTKLMEQVEAEAIKRGCKIAYTNTFTWQAPEFYKKLGYVQYGELVDHPVGNSLIYLRKDLV